MVSYCTWQYGCLPMLHYNHNDAHVIIDAIKFTPKPGLKPRANSERLFHGSTPGSGDDTKDASTSDTAGRNYTTNIVIHEVGHNLGLPHIGVTVGKPLATTPGSTVCTVATQFTAICYERRSVGEISCRMGLGKTFYASDADP